MSAVCKAMVSDRLRDKLWVAVGLAIGLLWPSVPRRGNKIKPLCFTVAFPVGKPVRRPFLCDWRITHNSLLALAVFALHRHAEWTMAGPGGDLYDRIMIASRGLCKGR